MKSYKAILFVLFSVFLNSNCLAQKENNIWYFGKYCGLDFNFTPPKVLTNGHLSTLEGVASICNSQGALLFYTDGITVWNKYLDTMVNGSGLYGHISSTQSALIIKKPASDSLYYIFTSDVYGYTHHGICYSIVNIAAHGGAGALIQKNIPLNTGFTSEKLTAINDAAGCGFWIICHSGNSNRFYSYHLTNTGLDTSAVISQQGFDYSAVSYGATMGYLKPSPDGNKLAAALFIGTVLEMFDFDRSTGAIVATTVIDSLDTAIQDGYYGVSFSPDSKLLYASKYNGDIYQFNISLPTYSAINASKIKLASFNCPTGAIQAGPDGALYITRVCPISAGNWLATIRNPNIQGTGCNFIDTGVFIGTIASSSSPQLGLPNFLESPAPFASALWLGPDTTACNTPGITLKPFQYLATTYLWNTGDTGAYIIARNSGDYWIESATEYCGLKRDSIKVTLITDTIKINLGSDTIVCGTSILLSAPSIPQATYLWSNGLKGKFINVFENGQYWVQVKALCGNRADTINVTVVKDTVPKMYLGPDTTLCAYSYSLKADSAKGARYTWSTGDTGITITVNHSGIYWVKAYNPCQVRTDTVSVNIYSDSVKGLYFGNDTLLCSGSMVLQGKPVAGNRYLWSTGDTGISININGPGTYWLHQKAHCDEALDTITVRYFIDATSLNLGKDTIVCGPSYNLNTASIAGNHYLWNTGDTVTAITATATGQYWLKISNICNIYNDTVNISIIKDKIPSVDFGKDTILCAKDYLLSVPRTSNAHYTWSNGDTAVTSFKITKDGTYWLKAYNYCETKGDTITIGLVQDSITSVSLGKDTLVCDTELELDAGFVPKATYHWSTEDTVQKITVTKTGSYAVEVSTYICNTKLRDTVRVDFFEPKPLVLQDDTTMCEQVFENLTIKSPLYYNSYIWNTGETTPQITVNNEGNYILTVKDICDNNFSDTVNLQLCDCKLYIPNAFTPNKNGLNDRFTITSSSCPLIKFHLKIFNRWGQLIYETGDPALGWDGTYLGEPVPVDAYIYSLSYRYAYMHTTPDFTGIVNVIR